MTGSASSSRLHVAAKAEISNELERLFDKVTTSLHAYHAQADGELLRRAFEFAHKHHAGQMRRSGQPYIVHPLRVALGVTDMRLDVASVCAAFLHDVVEDCDVSVADIENAFGQEIAFLVDGVTKLGQLNFTSREDRQAESFRKMLVAMAKDIRVLLVKLADRLDNMKTLEHMKPDSQERIANETMEIYAPLAGRLGIHWIKAELEDNSFKYLNPDAYANLIRDIKRTNKETEKYTQEVTRHIQDMLISRGFALETSGRAKNLYSVHNKMRRSGCNFEQIHDFIAFRVLMESVSDCYAALGVIHSEWTPIPGRFKDYIALPKANMYQSLHTTVIGPRKKRIEIQIRTYEMHRISEMGIAAHWQYKEKSGGISAKDASRFAWLKQLIEYQQDLSDPAEFLESIKTDLFAEDVYVFTPNGDLVTLRQGACPVDFAFTVHSEVGHHCAGAKVNGAMVPLRHQLVNGDVVEIITKKTQNPSKDWLDFVVSSRARAKIRSYLRIEQRRQSRELGRELVERELRKIGISFSRFLKSEQLKTTLQAFKCRSEDELFVQIGYGKIALPDVIESANPVSAVEKKSIAPSVLEKAADKAKGREKSGGIRIGDIEDVLVRFAKCCNPVVGEPIMGWITRGRGVSVHRRGCARTMELDPQRKIDVQWSQTSKVDLPVSLRVTTNNEPGILAKISTVFTDEGFNINQATCRPVDKNKAINIFQFTVPDVRRLKSLIRGISRLKGVENVERV